jgi:chromosome segregation ATPase
MASEERLQELRDQVWSLERERSTLADDLNQLREQLRNCEMKRHELEGELLERTDKLNELIVQNNALNAEREGFLANIRGLQIELVSAREMSAAQQQISQAREAALTAEIERLRDTLAHERRAHEEAVRALENKFAERLEAAVLVAEQTTSGEKSRMNEMLQAAQIRNETLVLEKQQRIESCMSEIDKLQTHLQEARKDSANAYARLGYVPPVSCRSVFRC